VPTKIDLSTPAKRAKLAPRHRPYWTEITRGVRLGYRRADADRAGTWYGRSFVAAEHRYDQWTLGAADDLGRATNGSTILSHRQAAERVHRGKPTTVAVPKDPSAYTVAHAVAEYIQYLQTDKKAGTGVKARLNTYLVKKLGSISLAQLTHDDLDRWRRWALDYRPAGRRDWPKYFRAAATAEELERRLKEAKEHLGKPTPPKVIAAYERRSRQIQGLIKVRKHGPAPTKPRPKPKAVDADETMRRRKETVNRVINDLKAVLNRAHANGRVASDQAWSRLQRWKNTGAARLRWLTLDEITRLRNACDPGWRRVIDAALATGCRWGELRRARVRDFDPTGGGTLLIPRSKGGKPRHVPLSDEGRALFETLTAGRDPDAYIFTNAAGESYGDHDQARRTRDASAAARLSPPASFHALRHTYASHLVQAGVPLLFVARALGHGDTRMVEKHYGHLAPTTVADAVRANLPRFGLTASDNVRRIRT
jgi:integrase